MKTKSHHNKQRHSRICTCLMPLGIVMLILLSPASTFAERTLVDIIVAQNVKSELQPKLDRLAADLRNDGYTTRITSWPAGKSAEDVWDHLKDRYDNDNIQGALLVGHIPVAGGGDTDIPYWNMDSYRSTSPKHIWLSRFYAPPSSSYGDEVSLLTNALDANHYYRTGKSRLPHKAWVHSCATGDNGYCRGTSAGNTWAAEALDTWKTSEAVDPEGLAEAVFELGGDILDETSHGSNGRYAKGSVSITKLHRYGCNIRFILASSCRTAGLGGVINTQTIVDNTQNVLSIGATEGIWQPGFRIMESSGRSFRSRINSGTAWGKALVSSYTFSRQSQKMTIIYGDLSLSSNTKGHRVAPENRIPTVSLAHPVPGRPMVGAPVEFTATIHDADNEPINVEWFVSEKQDGTPDRVVTNVSNGTVTFSYSYGKTGEVEPYVVVKDPWMAAQRSEEKIVLNVGDRTELNLKTIVSALDPDLLLVTESGYDESVVRLGKPGSDQRHVWDIRKHRTQFKFYNNENGYALRGKAEGDTMTTEASAAFPMSVDTVGNGLYRIGDKGMDRWLTADRGLVDAPVVMRTRQAGDVQLWRIEEYHGDATAVNQLTTETGNTRPFRSIGHGILSVKLPRTGPVSVTLFNLHGRKVAAVRQDAHESGTVTIDMRDHAPAGSVHILRIDGAGFTHISRIGLH